MAHFQLLYGFSPDVKSGKHPSVGTGNETPERFRRLLTERRGSNSDSNKLLNFNAVRIVKDGSSVGVLSPQAGGGQQRGATHSPRTARKFVDRSEDILRFCSNHSLPSITYHNEGHIFDVNCHDTAAVCFNEEVWICTSFPDMKTGSHSGYVLDIDDDGSCTYTCLAWSPDGQKLAVGTCGPEVHVYDASTLQCVRRVCNLTDHDLPLALSWSSNTFCGGSKLGSVWITDVRDPNADVQTLLGAKTTRRRNSLLKQITTLKYSPDFCHIACGDIEGNLAIWDCNNNNGSVMMKKVAANFPVEHGVRDLAWSPLQSNLLAAGVGSSDDKGSIVMWNASLGLIRKDIPTESRVNSLVWSKVNNELVSGHGEPEKCVIIWKYPSMREVFQFNGHTSAVRKVITNSENSYLYSLSEDETIRIWKYPRAVTRARTLSIPGAMHISPSPFSILDLGSSIR